MFQKFKYWLFGDRTTHAPNILQFLENSNDPRQIPRPAKINSINNNNRGVSAGSGINNSEYRPCSCSNCCEIFDNFSECSICMEPLQGTAICSCRFCGNYSCWNCSEKVLHCPFCRIRYYPRESRVRNYALERVLSKLELPCRYVRWGCRVLIQEEDRLSHETSCSFAPSTCPLERLCGWHGDTTDITKHLKDCHNMTLIVSNEINIEISNFRVKLLTAVTVARLYTISLKCHGNIYICRLKMRNLKLRLLFFQITGDSSAEHQKFEALLEISTAGRLLRGAVEIFPKHKNNKELVIAGRTLLCAAKQTEDFIKIRITIKPIICM